MTPQIRAVEEDQPGQPRDLPGLGGKRHRDAPAECRAEDQLWCRDEAFHEWIDDRQGSADDRKRLCQPVERQYECDCDQRQRHEQYECLDGCNLASRERPVARSRDGAVDVPVGEVVHDAPRGPHDYHTDDEHHEHVRVGTTFAGDPQCP